MKSPELIPLHPSTSEKAKIRGSQKFFVFENYPQIIIQHHQRLIIAHGNKAGLGVEIDSIEEDQVAHSEVDFLDLLVVRGHEIGVGGGLEIEGIFVVVGLSEEC